MKIAIFGDSYGVNMNHHNQTLSWIDIIKSKFNIDNFCEGGSSLYYQYNLFIKNQENYDKIIFLITNPGRLYIEDCNVQKHVSHYGTANYWLSKANNLQDKLILTAATQYFLYLQNSNFDNLIHQLLLTDIKKTGSNILFIPCFENSLPGTINCLNKACVIDWQHYNLDDPETYIDKRHCHMNETNNEILANEILDYLINDKFNLDNCNWMVDTKPINFYFEKNENSNFW